MNNATPVMEVLITVQFAPAMSTLNLLQASALANRLIDSYPLFSQVSRAGPMPAQFGQQSLEFSVGGIPRLQLVSSDLDFKVLLQDDRFSVGWSRTGPISESPNYPGFSEILRRAGEVAHVVNEFAREHGFGVIRPANAEILYEDMFLIGEAGNQRRRLSEVFAFLSPDFKLPTIGFNWSWATRLLDIDGYAELTASGFYHDPAGEAQVQLQTAIRMDVSGLDWPSLEQACQTGRANANRLFEGVVKSQARAT